MYKINNTVYNIVFLTSFSFWKDILHQCDMYILHIRWDTLNYFFKQKLHKFILKNV